MTQEISVIAMLSGLKSSISASRGSQIAVKFDMSGASYIQNVQAIGTSPEAIDMGDTGAGGWFLGINRSATAIKLHIGAGDDQFAEIPQNGSALFKRPPSGTMKASVGSGSADLEYLAFSA